jgi:hypothetical protein
MTSSPAVLSSLAASNKALSESMALTYQPIARLPAIP